MLCISLGAAGRACDRGGSLLYRLAAIIWAGRAPVLAKRIAGCRRRAMMGFVGYRKEIEVGLRTARKNRERLLFREPIIKQGS